MKINHINYKIIFMLFGVILMSACGYTKNIKLSTNSQKAKSQILEIVPLGTPVKIAKEKMQEIGFRCEDTKNSLFGDKIDHADGSIEWHNYDNLNFIECVRTQNVWIVIPDTWIIGLVYNKHNIITNLYIQIWGPSMF